MHGRASDGRPHEIVRTGTMFLLGFVFGATATMILAVWIDS